MTTIAYHHESRTIACDSRISRGGIILTNSADKLTVVNGVRFFFCGKVCDEQIMIDGYFGADLKVVPECRAIVIDNGQVFMVTSSSDANIEKCPLSFNEAIGSGEEFALSAMDFGKSAEQAVEYACTRDAYSGGEIRVYKVD